MKRANNQENFELITQRYPKSGISEAYRTLRTNLEFAGMDQPFQSIMVTSANAQEGKSTVISNLAVVMAQAGHRVILVDCDLRKPVQHKIFFLENSKGFTNCILQKSDVSEFAHTGLDNHLTVLTSGPIPPNPAEILISARTRAFWQSLMNEFDYVLIDAPPMLAVTDAAVLSNQVDGVILVVRSGVTRIEVARQVKEQLVKANARLIGAVLNQVKTSNRDYYQYYYYSDDHN